MDKATRLMALKLFLEVFATVFIGGCLIVAVEVFWPT